MQNRTFRTGTLHTTKRVPLLPVVELQLKCSINRKQEDYKWIRNCIAGVICLSLVFHCCISLLGSDDSTVGRCRACTRCSASEKGWGNSGASAWLTGLQIKLEPKARFHHIPAMLRSGKAPEYSADHSQLSACTSKGNTMCARVCVCVFGGAGGGGGGWTEMSRENCL